MSFDESRVGRSASRRDDCGDGRTRETVELEAWVRKGVRGQLRVRGTVMLTGQLALIVAALFAGAAVYINVAEQPAPPAAR